MDGLTICKTLREREVKTPIIILTAKNELKNKVELLSSGADDYMVKPLAFEELYARINSILRRPVEMKPLTLKVRDIELRPSEHEVYKADNAMNLTLKEFVLLEYFMRNPGKVINREELISHLWDFNNNSFSNVVDVHVKNLRKKLNSKGEKNILETIRGIGYRLKD